MSARSQLGTALAAALPKFRIIPTERFPEKLTKTTIIVRHRDYTPAPNAQGTLLAGLIVTIYTHIVDIEKAENELDNALPDLLAALQSIPSITWSRASKVLHSDTYLGFDVEVSVPVNIT